MSSRSEDTEWILNKMISSVIYPITVPFPLNALEIGF